MTLLCCVSAAARADLVADRDGVDDRSLRVKSWMASGDVGEAVRLAVAAGC